MARARGCGWTTNEGRNRVTPGSRHCLPLKSVAEQADRRRALARVAMELAVQLAPDVPADPMGGIERDRYEMWLGPCVLEDITDQAVFVAAPDAIRGWLPARQVRQVKRAASRVLGRPVSRVVFVVWPPEHERAAFWTFAQLEARALETARPDGPMRVAS